MAIISENIDGNVITVTINSSNLEKAKYDTTTKILTVTFKKGLVYEYTDVPWELFTKFRLSPSQGSFFNKEISKNYKYKKL